MIVLNWNGKKNTSECLNSLHHLEYPNYEIIVVDNASTDGSQRFLKENFPEIALIENERNLGFGGGFNVGIIEAYRRYADYVLCLNNDVVVDKNIVMELVKVGELSTKIGGLCPMEYYYDEPRRINSAGGIARIMRSKVFGHGELDEGRYNRVGETRLLCGPAMMLKAKTLLDIGLLSENYFYGPEDQDIVLRLNKAGYKIMFVPNAKLWHKGLGATGRKITPVNTYFSIRNHLLFAKKHASKFGLIAFLPYWLFYSLFTLFRFLILHEMRHIDAVMKGVLWHVDRKLLPPDSFMVETLRG